MQVLGVSNSIFSRRQSIFCFLSLRRLRKCPMTIDVPRPSVCDVIRFLMAEERERPKKKRLSNLEKVAGCGKKRPPADLLWLFSHVEQTCNDTESDRDTQEVSSSLFQPLTVNVPLVEQQTYQQWRSFMRQQRLSHYRRLRQRTIIIQPFTSPPLPGYTLHEVDTGVLEHLRSFCTAFFSGMTVELASAVDLTTVPNLTSRVHPDTQRLQYLVGDINKYLQRRRPSHAQCVIGVTTVDLYPSPDWNFVLGHASLTTGCGVFGFGRYFSSLFANSSPTVRQQLEQLWILSRVREDLT